MTNFSSKNLNGKIAVVTGGGSGIGQAICLELAQRGSIVCVVDIQEPTETLEKIKQNNGIAYAFICDVSNEAQVEMVIKKIKDVHGLDILINNAGVSHIGDVLSTKSEDFDRLVNINVKGVYYFLKSFLKHLDGRPGVILNMASIASKIGIKDRFAYSMSKGAVLSMTLSVAKDFVEKGVRCNCICPARVHTPFVDDFIDKNYSDKKVEMMEQLSKYQPIGRMGLPSEIAKLSTFLVSDDASFITGAAIDIDGGVIGIR